jgi:hypothetical protein
MQLEVLKILKKWAPMTGGDIGATRRRSATGRKNTAGAPPANVRCEMRELQSIETLLVVRRIRA